MFVCVCALALYFLMFSFISTGSTSQKALLDEALAVVQREDPSLTVREDEESGVSFHLGHINV